MSSARQSPMPIDDDDSFMEVEEQADDESDPSVEVAIDLDESDLSEGSERSDSSRSGDEGNLEDVVGRFSAFGDRSSDEEEEEEEEDESRAASAASDASTDGSESDIEEEDVSSSDFSDDESDVSMPSSDGSEDEEEAEEEPMEEEADGDVRLPEVYVLPNPRRGGQVAVVPEPPVDMEEEDESDEELDEDEMIAIEGLVALGEQDAEVVHPSPPSTPLLTRSH